MSVSVIEIYRRYEIPPNLRRHHLRAAAVAALMCDAWHGPPVRRERLVRVLLLHDLGNIVKADYKAWPQVLEEEQPRVAHWIGVHQRYRARFGEDADRATRTLAGEVGLDREELALLDGMSFMHNERTLAGRDYETKLAAYADQRVGPFGILSLYDRLEEAKARYGAGPGAFMGSRRAATLMACAHRIEQEVFCHCTLRPEDIDDRTAQPVMEALRSFEI